MSEAFLESVNPYNGEILGRVDVSTEDDIRAKVHIASDAWQSWRKVSFAEKVRKLQGFASLLEEETESMAMLITRETGKPLWESRTEVKAMINKVGISVEAYEARCSSLEMAGAHTRFHPLGLVGVLGPFNFPGHLPNGQIVPALLAGNAILFKPSEHTPLTGQALCDLFYKAGIPREILQIVQGGGRVGECLVKTPSLKGLFFTGSARTGLKIHQALAGRPQTLLALEMGGNNPLVVDSFEDVEEAARLICQSSFITAGQRCTCARRLYLPDDTMGNDLLIRIEAMTRDLVVGNPLEESFMGTVINAQAADACFSFEALLKGSGGRSILPLRRCGPALVKPGLMDMTGAKFVDEECFGPLLQIFRYRRFEDAIEGCNRSAYGLAAGLLSTSEDTYREFYQSVHSGIINWNTPLTGASSKAPFGGVGLSGNHRPGAWLSADFCSYPIASLEKPSLASMGELPGFPAKGGGS